MPFSFLKNILNPARENITGFVQKNLPTNTVSPSGIVDFDPKNIVLGSSLKEQTGQFMQYPIETRDQEHYILMDIIERPAKDEIISKDGNLKGISLQKRNLEDIILPSDEKFNNRFFGEEGIISAKRVKRRIKNTIAIYMPQTVKFGFAADYGAAEVGNLVGVGAKIKDSIGKKSMTDLTAGLLQVGKFLEGGVDFFSLGTATGASAAFQRRTGIAPAAMTEMIFNGIDYRTFSFDFKFTPRSRKESDLVRNILHTIKLSMLPTKFGEGSSIAAYTVPDEFVIRFMKGDKINPYLDVVGICACTGVDITYGGDKFSTHAYGDPVTIDATLTFRELELVERQRYQQLTNSARGVKSTGS